MSDELRNCPFCGGDGAITEAEGTFYAHCANVDCYCCVGEALDRSAMPDHMFASEEEARAAWNRRAPSAAPSSELRERVARAIRCRLHETCTDEPCKPDDGIACGCSYTLADAAIAAMREHEAAGWQPIETAEKDGECILAWKPDEARSGELMAVVYWSDLGCLNGWVAVGGLHTMNPTHWRPLPAAPAAAGDAT